MSKSSYVLRALKILGLEEMLKLSKVLQHQQGNLKKAAGDELVFWDDAPQGRPSVEAKEEARILDFPKSKVAGEAPPKQDPVEKSEEVGALLTSDLVLWQRELSRSHADNVHKLDAVQGYKRSTEMYVVKTSGLDGKDKIRFASTNGVLINKKQA